MKMNIIITIILGILTFFYLVKPEIPAKIFYKNAKGSALKKAKKDIRLNLGILVAIAFVFFLLKLLN